MTQIQQQDAHQAAPSARANFDTNRSLTKYILLGIITLGIYSVWVTARSGEDLNAAASRWDNKRSMNYWLMTFVIIPITFGIAAPVWWHKTSDRIGSEQARRGLQKTVSPADFWLWGVLGSFIVVGPFIFIRKWLHAMNDICRDYNENG